MRQTPRDDSVGARRRERTVSGRRLAAMFSEAGDASDAQGEFFPASIGRASATSRHLAPILTLFRPSIALRPQLHAEPPSRPHRRGWSHDPSTANVRSNTRALRNDVQSRAESRATTQWRLAQQQTSAQRLEITCDPIQWLRLGFAAPRAPRVCVRLPIGAFTSSIRPVSSGASLGCGSYSSVAPQVRHSITYLSGISRTRIEVARHNRHRAGGGTPSMIERRPQGGCPPRGKLKQAAAAHMKHVRTARVAAPH
jgi:hypothetical protein